MGQTICQHPICLKANFHPSSYLETSLEQWAMQFHEGTWQPKPRAAQVRGSRSRIRHYKDIVKLRVHYYKEIFRNSEENFSALMVLELFCRKEQHLILRDSTAFSKVCVDSSTQWQTPLNLERELFCTRDMRELQWKFFLSRQVVAWSGARNILPHNPVPAEMCHLRALSIWQNSLMTSPGLLAPCHGFAGSFGTISRISTGCTVYNGVRSLWIKIIYLGYHAWRTPSCLQRWNCIIRAERYAGLLK